MLNQKVMVSLSESDYAAFASMLFLEEIVILIRVILCPYKPLSDKR